MRERTAEVKLKVQDSHSILMGWHLGDADLPSGEKCSVTAIGNNMQITIDGDMQIMADIRPIVMAAYELREGHDMDYERDVQRRADKVTESIENLLRADSNLHQLEELVSGAIESIQGKSYYCDIHG